MIEAMSRSLKRVLLQTLLVAGPVSLLFIGFLGTAAWPFVLASLLLAATFSLEKSWQALETLWRV